jgi:hypothetical protein
VGFARSSIEAARARIWVSIEWLGAVIENRSSCTPRTTWSATSAGSV